MFALTALVFKHLEILFDSCQLLRLGELLLVKIGAEAMKKRLLRAVVYFIRIITRERNLCALHNTERIFTEKGFVLLDVDGADTRRTRHKREFWLNALSGILGGLGAGKFF